MSQGHRTHHPLHHYTHIFRKDIKRLPRVAVLTIASLSVFNVGWGFAEPFFSLYLEGFSDNYTTIGLFNSLGIGAGLLVILPLGRLLDELPAHRLMAIAKWGYVLIGIGYVVAGITSAVPLLLAVLLFNGICSPFVWTSAHSLLRGSSSKSHDTGLTMGLYYALRQFAWLCGLGLALLVVWKFPMFFIFFPVILFSLLSMLVDKRMKTDVTADQRPLWQIFQTLWKQPGFAAGMLQTIRQASARLWWSYTMLLGTGVITILGLFFLPLYAQHHGFSFVEIGIMVLLMNLPALLSIAVGDMTDHIGKQIPLTIGFVVAIIGLLGLAVWSQADGWLIGWAIMTMASYAFINPALNAYITSTATPNTSGMTSALADCILTIASVVFGPLIGFGITHLGWSQLFTLIALGLAVLAIGGAIVWTILPIPKHLLADSSS